MHCFWQHEARCNSHWFSCPSAGNEWRIHWVTHRDFQIWEQHWSCVAAPNIWIFTCFPFKTVLLSPLVQPLPLLLGTQAHELFLSNSGLEGRQKNKNLRNSSLKNPCLWRNCSMSCSVPVGLPSTEPHAEITMFKLFRKAIEKQTSVSWWLRLYFGSTFTGQPWVKEKTIFYKWEKILYLKLV